MELEKRVLVIKLNKVIKPSLTVELFKLLNYTYNDFTSFTVISDICKKNNSSVKQIRDTYCKPSERVMLS